MKKSFLILALLFAAFALNAQDCIDAVILKVDGSQLSDTLYCKIMAEDETNYTIDNGFAITSISKNTVEKVLLCTREMTAYEVYKFKGIDNVTMDYFQNNQTAGNYFRKAAFNMYLASGLAIVGSGSIVLGLTAFQGKYQNVWIIGGSIVSASAVFFIVMAWNKIYKAGKLLDLNGKAALHLSSTQEGHLGLQLKF
ncbi:hypothetical protein LJB75_01025 [Bacteroidales bacterium OttesenSCG-928-L19]|nr:hypothetical protein [Bacteroidales bacterium OttesenSCG-928-L19]